MSNVKKFKQLGLIKTNLTCKELENIFYEHFEEVLGPSYVTSKFTSTILTPDYAKFLLL